MEKNFYYTILGVSSNATTEEIEQRYRELIKKYHPDTGVSNDAMFKLLTEARETLTDYEKRRNYDESQKNEMESDAQSGTYQNKETDAYNQTAESYEYDQPRRYLFGLDFTQFLIIHLMALLLGIKVFLKPDSSFQLLIIMMINITLFFLLSNIASLGEAMKAIFGLMVMGVILIFSLGIAILLLKLDPKTESMVTVAIFVVIPFLIYMSYFLRAMKMLKPAKRFGSIRKATTYIGFLCSIILVGICLINIPLIYNDVYAQNIKSAMAKEKSKEKDEYLSSYESREIPSSFNLNNVTLSEGGNISIDTILKSKTTFSVVKDNAKASVEVDLYLYPFEYMVKDEALEYLKFVTDSKARYEKESASYDFGVIRFVMMDSLKSSEYESVESKEYSISVDIQPKNEAYKNGYYVDGVALIPKTEVKMFSTIDGYIMFKVPKDYNVYDLIIKIDGSGQFIVNVPDYFE